MSLSKACADGDHADCDPKLRNFPCSCRCHDEKNVEHVKGWKKSKDGRR